jgi:hypothetical protein
MTDRFGCEGPKQSREAEVRVVLEAQFIESHERGLADGDIPLGFNRSRRILAHNHSMRTRSI